MTQRNIGQCPTTGGVGICKFSLILCITISALRTFATAEVSTEFNVKDYGAIGDGKTLETAAINKAIQECSTSGGGTVYFPAGTYLSGTLRLQSNVTLFIAAGAILLGSKEVRDYQGVDKYEEFTLLHGKDIHNVAIVGHGLINGNKVFDPKAIPAKVDNPDKLPGWGGEYMRGPHSIVFNNCQDILIRDITVKDASDYAIFMLSCENINIQGVTVTGGWDGINMYYCSYVSISDCHLQTGDDCIAATECENMMITNSFINSSCNGFRLMAGNEHILINNCTIYGPGRYEHRSSHRHNTISGITIQPFGRIRPNQVIDDITISDVSMVNVRTPFWLGLRSEDAGLRNISISNVTVTGAGKVASCFQGAPDNPIENIVLNNVRIVSEGGGTKEQSQIVVPASMGDAFPILPSYGFYGRHIKGLEFHNVRVGFTNKDLRPALICEEVENLNLDGFDAQRSSETESPIVLKNVKNLSAHDLNIPIVTPKYRGISLSFTNKQGKAIEGEPLSASVSIENIGHEGLSKVELLIDNDTMTKWIWMKQNQTKKVTFPDIKFHESGKHQIKVGIFTKKVVVEPRPETPTFVYSNLEVRPVIYKNMGAVASIGNHGSDKGVENVKLYVDNKVVHSKQLTLLPGETEEVSFVYPLTKAGTYKVTIGSLPSKTVTAAGAVKSPYGTFANTKAEFYQVDDHFYIKAGREDYRDRLDEYGTIYLKDGIKENSVATVKVSNPDKLTGWEGRVGIVVRNDITKTETSPGYIILAISPSNGWSLQWDSDGDGQLDKYTEFDGYSEWPNWLKLEKKGNTFTGYYSTDGFDWNKVGTIELSGANIDQDIGLFASRSSAKFGDFTILVNEPLN